MQTYKHIHAEHGHRWANLEVTPTCNPREMQVKPGSSVGVYITGTPFHRRIKEIGTQII